MKTISLDNLVFDDATPVFEKYSHHNQHTQVKYEDIQILERFTCLPYSRTATFESVNECFFKTAAM